MTIAGQVRHAFFVQFNFASVTKYVWQGFRTIPVGDRIWEPVGPLATVDQVEDAVSDTVPIITLKVSGVSAELLALALSESDEVQGRLAYIYDLYFDANWQPIGDLAFFDVVRMDTIKIKKSLDQDTDSYTQVIEIACEQFLTNGPNPAYGRYSSADQWARQGNTNDLYFEFMAINQNRRQRWPTF